MGRSRADCGVGGCQRSAIAAQIIGEITDPAEFATAVEEIGPYLRAQGLPTDWIDDKITQRIPVLAQAKQRLTKADRAVIKTRFDASRQRRAGYGPTELVPPDFEWK